MMTRRHDIDALRVIAFGLLILYHVGMVYVAEWDFHVKSIYQAEWLQWPMIFLNRWRMSLLFMISGIAIGLARPDRGLWRFAGLRSWRLLLPLAFGMFVVVPIQPYCEGVANGHMAAGFGDFLLRYWQVRPWPAGSFTGAEFGFTWNHLWYLTYLWAYTLLLLVLLPLWRAPNVQAAVGDCRWPAWALILAGAVWLAACHLLLAPRFPQTGALVDDWAMHAEYLPLFLFGYAIATNTRFWDRVRDLRRITLSIALAAITVELSLRAAGRYLSPADIPVVLQSLPWYGIERVARAVYTWTTLLAIFGWARVLLDRPFRWLPYCTEAVFPWYILHQSLIVPLAFWLAPLQLGPVLEPVLVLSGTVAGCLILHEVVIRRVGLLRPLFGLKRKDGRARTTSSPLTDVPASGLPRT